MPFKSSDMKHDETVETALEDDVVHYKVALIWTSPEKGVRLQILCRYQESLVTTSRISLARISMPPDTYKHVKQRPVSPRR